MPVDQKIAEAYAKHVLQKLKTNPDELEEAERRMARKHQKYATLSQNAQQDLKSLQDQIKQAEARIRSLELQAVDHQGKANMALEMLISMKFEDESEADADFQEAVKKATALEAATTPPGPEGEQVEPDAGSNGNRKARRAKKAKVRRSNKPSVKTTSQGA